MAERFASNVALLDFIIRIYFMLHNISLSLAALMPVAINVIGFFYLVSPERVSGSFGLKQPASDTGTRAWLRLKGIRDVAAGLVVLTMMLTADRRSAGIALLVLAIIPFGDMSSLEQIPARAGQVRLICHFLSKIDRPGCNCGPQLSNLTSWRTHDRTNLARLHES